MKVDKQTPSGSERATTGSCWGRWRRTCARCARPIRTRTRASAIPARRLRKKVGKTGAREQINGARSSRTKFAMRIHKRIRPKLKGTPGAAAAGGVPQREAHLRAGDRRHARDIPWRRLLRRKELERKVGGNVAGAKEIGKLVAERAKERASAKWCSTAADISITAA